MPVRHSHERPHAIARISVDDLFGQYTYRIPDDAKLSANIADVLILYGDNGSGKTTLLKLAYHLLSPASDQGHRTYLARTRFRRVEVELADGTTVAAFRSGPDIEGVFSLSLTGRGGKVLEAEMALNDDGAVRAEGAPPTYFEILRCLSELELGIYFLADDRRMESNLIAEHEEEHPSMRALERLRGLSAKEYLAALKRHHHRIDLESAISRAVQWVRQQVLTGSNRGDANVMALYTEISRRIASAGQKDDDIPGRFSDLTKEVEELATRSESFSRFGLASPLDSKGLLTVLAKTPKARQSVMYSVLKPYLDGVRARLDALQSIQDLVSSFVRNLNSFYSDKLVTFDLRRGFEIVSSRRELISPTVLSSGEKQLMLLLCNTLVARSQPSIFIIDEPELSLNVKWQRKLVQALLETIRGSQVQFVLATHSLELLARHSDHVVKLVNCAPREDEWIDSNAEPLRSSLQGTH